MTLDPLFEPGNKTRVKVCGLTAMRDAAAALHAGADFIGIVFYEKSPRYLSPAQAADLLAALRGEFPPEHVRPVGVFVNSPADSVLKIASSLQLTAVQLHGAEDEAYVKRIREAARVIRAVRVKDEKSFDGLEGLLAFTSAFLFDAYSAAGYGGTGESFPHDLARSWIDRHPVLVAGGLRPETVGEVIQSLQPFGVDVSSGVETSPGIKSPDRIVAFLEAVRQADRMKFEAALPDFDSEISGPGGGRG